MSNRILIAYATHYGSTHEVAKEIAAEIHKCGFEVDLRAVQIVLSLEGYSAVVLGAPLYIGKWHKGAHEFLACHQQALTRRPVAIFALGPIGRDAKEMQGSRAQLDVELAQYRWLKAFTVEMFVGKYDPAELTFGHKLLTLLRASPLRGMAAADNRDWAVIRAWAGKLAAQIREIISTEGKAAVG